MLTSVQAELSRAIENFLNDTARCSPSILISKPKFHFLIHLPLYIRRFGPAIIASTERYESFNHVFRLSSIFSNRQAPSRDTCNTFSEQDIVKHIATGGFWHDAAANCWVQAGPDIHQHLLDHPEHMRLLSVPDLGCKVTGMINPVSRRYSIYSALILGETTLAPMVPRPGHRPEPRELLSWSETQSSNIMARPTITGAYFKAVSVIALHGDKVRDGSYVIYKRETDEKVCYQHQYEVETNHYHSPVSHLCTKFLLQRAIHSKPLA